MRNNTTRLPFLFCMMTALSLTAGAGIVASWDFNEGRTGDKFIESVDTVSSLKMIPCVRNSGTVEYASGNGDGSAAGLARMKAVLQVDDESGIIGIGFTNLTVTLDVDLTDDVSSTAVLLRSGHMSVPFNVYLLAGNILGVELQSSDGRSSGAVRTAGPALSQSAGWQTVSVVWDGTFVSIFVDGKEQKLAGGGTAKKVSVGPLKKSDAPMGVGGLIRGDGSTGQFLQSPIDNIVISN